MGRMAERAEMAARTAVVALTRVVGAAPEPADLDAAARALRSVSGGLGVLAGRDDLADVPDLDGEVRRALTGRPGAVVPSLRSTVVNARTARQLLSARTWRLLTMLDAEATALDRVARGDRADGGSAGAAPALATPAGAASLAAFDVTEALDRVLVPLAALAGLTNETVVRGPGWRFFDIGRRLERALLVLGLWRPCSSRPPTTRPLAMRGEIALAANESLVAYRRRHRTDVTLDALGGPAAGRPGQPPLGAVPARPAGRSTCTTCPTGRPAGPSWPPSARRSTASRPVCRSGRAPAIDGLGPVGALVLAVRQPVLEVGDLVPRGWFTERPRRVR